MPFGKPSAVSALNPWRPWLTFFLQALTEQVTRLTRKLERERLVLSVPPELSMRIVEFARAHGTITMVDAIRLAGSSRNTLEQHFRGLVERNQLAQHGSGRGVWYEVR